MSLLAVFFVNAWVPCSRTKAFLAPVQRVQEQPRTTVPDTGSVSMYSVFIWLSWNE